MEIIIGQPVLDQVEAITQTSIINLLYYSQRRTLHFVPVCGTTVVHDARNEIVSQAYNTEFDAIFFIDSDMEFPGFILEKMIQHDKDICGVLYVNKASGKQNTFKYDENLDEFFRYDEEFGKGLVEVGAVGAGILYVKRKVFDAIGSPWFFYEPGIGEDVTFCKRARELGFKTFVDTDIDVGHVAKIVRRVRNGNGT